ncbi:MAG: porphobilinogen synthase [Pseudomonadota bacterium]|nr:porphobilinogen synthase [Pseudomonadota bacterium]
MTVPPIKFTFSAGAGVASFPTTRLRRPRRHAWSRDLVRENNLTAHDLIWPVFVREGDNARDPVDSMPGVFRHSIDRLVDAVGEAAALGIPAVALFPQIDATLKDPTGSISTQADNLVCRAIAAIKAVHPEVGVICDAALDPFTSHGHDGVIDNGYVVNDASGELLCRHALVQAAAGCDIIAPSDMMDGRVGAIRAALDGAGFEHVQIMAYASKFASAFYGPFRDAVGSSSQLGKASKATYQMDPANGREALREVALDIAEGADSVMVKPGMPYLDVITNVRQNFDVPVFAYQVSGEYAMLQAAGANGWLDLEQVMMESLMGFKRAGAAGVLSYFAVDAARRLTAG